MILRALITLFFLCVTVQSYASTTTFTALEQRLATLSEQYHIKKTTQVSTKAAHKKNLPALQAHLQTLLKDNKQETATVTLLANFTLVKNTIDFDTVSFFLDHLLSQGLIDKAQELAKSGLAFNDAFISSRIHYHLAQYYFDRNHLDLAAKHLTEIENPQALNGQEQDYATVLFGIILQHRKQHRAAIKRYNSIKSDSVYYSYAQLNSAVAQVRQGWWTDVQISIEKALKKDKRKTQELSNRLLLVLAYSQLQNGFYRNARNTLRQISLDSIYANRALLALGLSALHQKDYSGAINAFEYLKKQDTQGLSVIESHLLIPYTYDKSKNTDKTVQLYTEAIAYFGQLITQIEQENLQLEVQKTITTIHLQKIAPLQRKAYQQLLSIASDDDSIYQQSYTALVKDFNHFIKNQIYLQHQRKSDSIKSYLSQAEYGLAKLYDNKR